MHRISTPQPIHHLLWMTGSLSSFSLMAIGARELSHHLSVFQTLSIRGVIGLLIITLLIHARHGLKSVYTTRFKLHLVRNIFHFGGQFSWFYAIGVLALAEVFAIEFTVPIWAVLIATLALKEKLTQRKMLAILLGLLGVICIVQPDVDALNHGTIIMLLGAISYGVAHTSTKGLSSTEAPLTILFYMCLIQLPMSLPFAFEYWVWPNTIEWLWLGLIGVAALSAHFCMTKALQLIDVGTVLTLDFLRLPLIATVGVLFYDEPLKLSLFAGALLMLTGNYLNARANSATNCHR